MKPSEIATVLDLAREIRRSGDVFNPLFVGPPGIAKSACVQEWCNNNTLPFIDLRAAYLESPDVIGFPKESMIDGKERTTHTLPEFWPTSGEGVLLLEEPNRGTTAVMNTFMQLLTDRKVHKYTLPPGWIVVGCINPESGEYDVNVMDPALKDRFEMFNIDYDKNTFVAYMKKNNWDKGLRLFVESGVWNYVLPENVSKTAGAKYLSPRTLSKLNAVLVSNFCLTQDQEMTIFNSILGNAMGRSFYAFKYSLKPILFKDLLNDTKKSLAMLKAYSSPDNLRNDLLSITVSDIIDDNTIEEDLLVKVCLALPVGTGVALIKELEFKRKDDTILQTVIGLSSELKKNFKDVIKLKE